MGVFLEMLSQDKADMRDEQRTNGRTRVGTVRSPGENEAKATRVYVIRSVGHEGCKIGISSHPKRRLSALQVSTPQKLDLFFQFRPASHKATAIEAKALTLLRPWRVRGEWLDCEPQLARVVIEALDADDPRIVNFVDALKVEHQAWIAVERCKFIPVEFDLMQPQPSKEQLKEMMQDRRDTARRLWNQTQNTARAFPDLYTRLGRWDL